MAYTALTRIDCIACNHMVHVESCFDIQSVASAGSLSADTMSHPPAAASDEHRIRSTLMRPLRSSLLHTGVFGSETLDWRHPPSSVCAPCNHSLIISVVPFPHSFCSQNGQRAFTDGGPRPRRTPSATDH